MGSGGPVRDFNAVCPLDSRYFDADVSRLLSERAYVSALLEVESAAASALVDFNICKLNDAEAIAEACRLVTAEMVHEEEFGEGGTKHDIRALVRCIQEPLSGHTRRWVHLGLTSYDVIDTARVLMLRRAVASLLEPRTMELLKALMALAWCYASTPQMGRTHGQHAVPITFGFAIALYVSRLGGSLLELRQRAQALKGNISGGVGAYCATKIVVADPLGYEKAVLAKLGLEPAEISTQIVPPEPTIRLLQEMGIMGGVVANLGRDMRNLMRTEINEVREAKVGGQVGSSTMPQKGNPTTLENAESFGHVLDALTLLPLLIQTSEHQRDLTNSAAARFLMMIPAALAYPLKRMAGVMAKLQVDPKRMAANMGMEGDLFLAEALYILLSAAGHPDAHETMRLISNEAREHGTSLDNAFSIHVEVQNVLARTGMSADVLPTLGALFDSPMSYCGLAREKAQAVVRSWEKRLKVPHAEIVQRARELCPKPAKEAA